MIKITVETIKLSLRFIFFISQSIEDKADTPIGTITNYMNKIIIKDRKSNNLRRNRNTTK